MTASIASGIVSLTIIVAFAVLDILAVRDIITQGGDQ